MNKYYVVGLKNDQIAKGALSMIADTIRNTFLETGKAIIEGRITGAREKWAVVRFEGYLLLDQEGSPYPDYDEVLYLNQTAWEVLVNNDVRLSKIDELNDLPDKKMGIFISMPIYEM